MAEHRILNEAHRRSTVVVADDHAAMLREISRLLEPDFQVLRTVSDGAAAVQAVVELNPEVVVLDIAMPVLSGIEAARHLKKMGLSTQIVFLTIGNDPEYLEAAKDLRASYVLKPLMKSDLVPTIKRTLGNCNSPSSSENA